MKRRKQFIWKIFVLRRWNEPFRSC